MQVEEKRGVRSSWRQIGQRTLTRINFKRLRSEELKVTFSENRREQYRMVIDNRDSPPLDVSGIQAAGNVYELVFFAVPKETYRLVYGNAEAEPAGYDTVAIQQALNEGFRPTRASLGEREPGVDVDRRGLRLSDILSHTGFLITVVVLLVIVLGWGLYQAAGRIQEVPPD